MRKRALLLALGLLAAGLGSASVVEAKRPPRLPKVTGGGMALNENNVAGPPGVVFAGFTAHATRQLEPGVSYVARGQVQLVGRFPASDDFPIARVHGEVVCIWNHGSPLNTPHEGTSTSDADVWEIRFRLTHHTLALPPGLPPGTDIYLRIYAQDGGGRGSDFVGESFDEATDPTCNSTDDVPGWDLEELVRGNAKVH
jgi:hypothetical protein